MSPHKKFYKKLSLLIAISVVIGLINPCNLQAQQPPNIIFFFVDDMGWQDTSVPFYQELTELNKIYKTPNMEQLAVEGMKFTQAYACAVCSPSRISLMTGLNAARHKVTNWTLRKDKSPDPEHPVIQPPEWNMNGMSPDPGIEYTVHAITLPMLLQKAGYRTIHAGKAHFGAKGTPGENPLNLGFDVNIAGHAAGGPGSYLAKYNFSAAWRNGEHIWDIPGLEKYHGQDIYLTEALTIEANKAIDQSVADRKPFYLYMSHYAIHAPWEKDDRFYQKYIDAGLDEFQAKYAAMIEGMDKSLGDIMSNLKRHDIHDNTIIIFMSDNGQPSQAPLNKPLRGHKLLPYEGGVRVPMIVKWPGTTEPGSQCKEYLIIEDIFPSVLEMAGVKDYKQIGGKIDGISFVPYLKGEKTAKEERPIFWHFPHTYDQFPYSSVRKGDWKLIYHHTDRNLELFNLKDDIAEQTDLKYQNKQKLIDLTQILSDYLVESNALMPLDKTTGNQVEFPIEVLDRLENFKNMMVQAVECKPHPRQLAWQQNEFIAFIHFGVNTFTGREWGTGFEDPKLFNPQNLDTDQWCKAMKAAGMKMAIFGAKHHDGFCLWQTRYTKQSVVGTSWREGKGDVIKDLAASCKKYGLKLGIYLSPADLFQIENSHGLYGNGSKYNEKEIPRPVAGRPFQDKRSFKYNVDDYNEYFMNQLFELLTEYGPIHEVWFDGAHPKRKGGQKYTYDQWYDLIRKLAPDAVIAIKGPDVRWCGNEAGRTRESEWSVIPIGGHPDNWDWPDMMNENLGSLEKIKTILDAGGFLHWYPAETNTSIRHGWFWRDEQQYVKSTEEILDTWYRSVGGNSVFLLNIPPNTNGLFSDRDVKVLSNVGKILNTTFKINLASDGRAVASAIRDPNYNAANILDGKSSTCWMPPDWMTPTEITVNLTEKHRFNRVMIQEQIAEFSQRIEKFAIDAFVDGSWSEIATGTTVGYKRICQTNTIITDRVRIRILKSRICPTISNFGLFYEEVRINAPEIRRNKKGMVTIACNPSGPVIRYTIDGTNPDVQSPIYTTAFKFKKAGMVKAVAFHPDDGHRSGVVSREFDICPAKWKIIGVSSEQADNKEEAFRAIDGDPGTNWITRWRPDEPAHPHYIAIDLGEVLDLKGFTYTPRTNANYNGTIKSFAFYISNDGKNWGEPAVQGQFDNIVNDPTKKYVYFDELLKARYIKLVALSEIRSNPWTSAGEIGVITKKAE